jgi:hypothetical protein
VSTYLLDLVLPEVRNGVYYDPRQRSSKVEDLVDDKRHDSCSQDVVAHPCVPCKPELFKVVELYIVLGDLLEGAPVRVLRHWRQNGGCVPKVLLVQRTNCFRALSGTYILAVRDNKKSNVQLYHSAVNERATAGGRSYEVRTVQ